MRGVVVTLVLVVLGVLVGPAAAAAQESGEVNVYVVKSPQQNGGRADTLRSVAGRTLGSTARANEIFELNRGRAQSDGAALLSPDDVLHPGWLLRLPPDATGPDVKKGLLAGSSARPDQSGNSGFQVPLTYAVVAVVVLLELILVVVFRRRLVAGFRVVRDDLTRWRRRLAEPFRCRRELRSNRALAQRWHGDRRTLALASSVFAELDGTARPTVAADVHSDMVVAHTPDGVTLPAPWQEGDPNTWSRPLDGLAHPGPPVVRVGGTPDYQSVLDLSWCDGALAVDGPAKLGRELVTTLLAGLAGRTGLQLITLGAFAPAGGGVRAVGDAQELAALVRAGGGGEVPTAPLRGAARRRRLRGVVAVGPEIDPQAALEVVEICNQRDSEWLAVVVDVAVAAHWRWTIRRDGTLDVPLIERELVAAL